MRGTSIRQIPTVAILLAAAAVSASLVFLGLLIGRQSSPAPVDEKLLDRKIREEVATQLRNEQLMDPLIGGAIVRFIDKQRRGEAAAAGERLKGMRRVARSRDHIYGNPDAPLSLVEYSDFECPYCKKFHPTAKKIVAAYGGKVNWVYRHFPLAFHNPLAQKEAEASECAAELGGNDAFWRYADLVYARTKSNGKGLPIDKLAPLAAEIGLDETKFKSCLDSGRMAARVAEDFADGSKIGVEGTPGNVLRHNKHGEARFRPGARPFEAFKKEIDEMLR